MSDKTHLRYTSIKDLLFKTKVIYKGKKPHSVFKRLSEMRDMAEKAKNQGDEEFQYIMLRRWLDAIEWLKQTQEYKEKDLLYLVNMSVNQISEIKNILADLNQRLDTQYKQHSKEKMLEASNTTEHMELDVNETNMDANMLPIDGPIRLPETPTRDPLAADNEELITCDQVFQLLQNIDSRYLIIDIRLKKDFLDSRILSDKCVNIPHTEIHYGVLASHFEKYLYRDKKAFDLYKHRGAKYVDVIILLDQNVTSKLLTPNNELNILRKILEEWDPGIDHERIAILDGGYSEWVMRYPQFTTNPNVIEPTLNTTISNEILDDIVYPDWIQHSDDEGIVMKSQGTKSTALKPICKDEKTSKVDTKRNKIHLKHTDSEKENSLSSAHSLYIYSNFVNLPQSMEIDPVPKNNNDNVLEYEDDTGKLQHKETSGVIMKPQVSLKPVIDRTNKPATFKKSTPESKIVLNLMKKLNDLAKSKEKYIEEILEQERSLYMQHGLKHKDLNEEENIRSNLKSLYATLEDTQKAHLMVEDELNKYAKTKSIEFSPAEKSEKLNLKFNLTLLNRRISDIATERKKLREKSMQNEYKELSTKDNENNIRKEPLKTDKSSVSGGLERSYSSPNLLKLIDRKAPRVDRSSKPQISAHNQNGTIGNDNVKVSHLSWANREERMTPVHGTVHPGITGLKNLGNSCYMNSIIQCLSNTTHLAKYFTDNLYVDDLNTSNESTTQGQVVEEVAQVIKALWRGQYKSISPHDLKIAVGQYKLQFESYEQQDSHEFLTFLLDWMHNDLKKGCKTHIDMTVAEKAWDKAMDSQRSIISDLFFGQLRSTITCSSCKQGSTTYETFNSLTTSLPHPNRCTLNDCILKFVTGQKVVGWKCPKCQLPREAVKKFDFVKLAPIIVIHLNRFAESGGWLEKRNTAVDFPLTGFNLKPHLVTDSNTVTISNIRSYSYSLYAMSNHYGTMEGGHYTAFCKNAAQNKWYKYDDQTVTEVSPSQVKSQNTSAYLLFYTSFSSNII